MLNSPRYREEHPEVLRGTAVQTVTSASVPERVALDPAARTNPRLREEYPALKAR